MAQIAAEDGIREIIATPHFDDLDRNAPRDDVARRIAEFQTALDEVSCPLTIRPGCEVFLTPETPHRFDAGDLVPLNRTSTLLVEVAFHEYPRYADDVMFQLQARGARLVLAHPERYAAFQADPSILEGIVSRGILAQVTAGSLLGYFGTRAKAAAETFMKRGLIHIIATDAHRATGNRTTAVLKARERAAELVGEERAEAMCTTLPEAIANGTLIDLPPVAAPEPGGWSKVRRWFAGARP